MPKTLRFKDGFSGPSAGLRDEVKKLQRALQQAGSEVGSDGLFGKDTEDAVKAFQRANGLSADGVVGSNTWDALETASRRKGKSAQEKTTNGTASQQEPRAAKQVSGKLPGFHGDLSWVHAREGHAGKAYWPGGASGVTLDPGVDLGHAKSTLIEAAYKSLLTDPQLEAAKSVFGIKGEKAKAALANNATLKTIRVTREQADDIFHFAAQPYWENIVKRFPKLADSDTPGSVQTVMLSISYNRGAYNRDLEVLTEPIAKKEWSSVAEIIGSMQQDHKLAGIRKRRQMEADLIRSELA